MRTVQEIYDEYHIPPWLQLHQLRVAAVGKTLAECIPNANVSEVVLTGLFHDMGNILKFNLSETNVIPGLITTDQELTRWRHVQRDFQNRYGADEHAATRAIVNEINIPEAVRVMVGDMGFSKACVISERGTIELQIIEYADQRVAPIGVVTLDERLADGGIRYAGKYGAASPEEAARYTDNLAALKQIEVMICARAGIDPSDIFAAKIEPMLDGLRKLSV